MKRFYIGVVIVMIVCCFTLSATAESARDEAVSKCKEAADMIKKIGLEAATAEINKKDGKFVTPNTYVFLMDTKGVMIGHPIKPSLIGKNLSDLKDSSGKEFFKEFIKVATSSGDGWVDYMWPKPGEETPSEKVSYILKTGDETFVGAGYYK